MTNLNAIDYTVISALGVSAFAGLMRGFLKEVISLITWVTACILGSLFATKVAGMFVHSGRAPSVLEIAGAFTSIFFVTVVVGSLLSYTITKVVEGSGISFVNRFLGALFGAARGAVMVVVVMFIVQMTPVATEDVWTQSQFVIAFRPTVQWFGDMVKPGIVGIKGQVDDAVRNVTTQLQNPAALYQGIIK
jgi:membrane protein required for colicin V production